MGYSTFLCSAVNSGMCVVSVLALNDASSVIGSQECNTAIKDAAGITWCQCQHQYEISYMTPKWLSGLEECSGAVGITQYWCQHCDSGTSTKEAIWHLNNCLDFGDATVMLIVLPTPDAEAGTVIPGQFMAPKVMWRFWTIVCTSEMQWYHQQCCQHHMRLMLAPALE